MHDFPQQAGRYNQSDGRSLAAIIAELKTEVVDFVRTRVQILISELRSKAQQSKAGVFLGAIGLLLGGTAFLMLTLALVALIAVAFQGSPYAFFFGFMIMGLLYLLFAGLIAVAAYRVLKGLAPERTIKVLREDKVWLEKEARNEI